MTSIAKVMIRHYRDTIGLERLFALTDDPVLRVKLEKIEIKMNNETCSFIKMYPTEYEFVDVYKQYIDNVLELLSMDGNLESLTPREVRSHPCVRVDLKKDHRKDVRAILTTHLLLSFDGETARDFSARIENSLFEFVSEHCRKSSHMYQIHWDNPVFKERYNDRLSIVLNHIIPDSLTCKRFGPLVLNKLKSGELSPEDLGKLDETSLCPEAIEKECEEIRIRAKQRVTKKFSTLFKCPQCGKKECETRETQTRSLDEAADIFCLCVCGHNFKVRA